MNDPSLISNSRNKVNLLEPQATNRTFESGNSNCFISTSVVILDLCYIVITPEPRLRRLERVFHCCSVCETMEDYKVGYLMVWKNYMSPCNSIVGLYLKGACDVK